VFATGQSVRPGQGRGRTTFRRPVPSFPELARQARAKDQDGRHCVVPHRPTPSSVVLCRPLSSSVVLCRPLSSSVVLCRPLSSSVVLCRPLSSPAVPCRPPPSSAVFRCFPLFSAVPHRPPPSPAVLCSYLPSPGRSCLRSWGSSSLLMTAVLGIKGRGRTTFCRPVSSGGLGSPPAGPYGGPGRLRTLVRVAFSPILRAHSKQHRRVVFRRGYLV